jgi:hypothetical protein
MSGPAEQGGPTELFFVLAKYGGLALLIIGIALLIYSFVGIIGAPPVALMNTFFILGLPGLVMIFIGQAIMKVASEKLEYQKEQSGKFVQNQEKQPENKILPSEKFNYQELKTKKSSTYVRCHKCDTENETGARTCKNCGASLTGKKLCTYCRKLNEPDVRFCKNCGHDFELM